MLTSAQTAGYPPLTVLFAILGAASVGLCALALGTWVGSARSDYIRRYNTTHGTKLPAGFLEEWVRQAMLNYESRRIDFFGLERQQRRKEQATRIWGAMDEPQADSELERLRVRAQRRSIIAITVFGVTTVGFVFFMWFFG